MSKIIFWKVTAPERGGVPLSISTEGETAGKACVVHKEHLPSKRGLGLRAKKGFKVSHRLLGKAVSGAVFPCRWQALLLVRFLEANIFVAHPRAEEYWVTGEEKLLFASCNSHELGKLSVELSQAILARTPEDELYRRFWPGAGLPW